jgi:uncharacterized protein (DUF2236 family)
MTDRPPVVLDGIGGFLAGPANVIMQLAQPPVGHGVIESKVDSGKAMLHPVKRFRTTFTYLSAAMYGSPDERARYRDAVNESHRQVRSDANSAVRYNAFDRDLQLWVAACLYYGAVDIVERMHGPLDDATADALYQFGARFGTTLQVPQEMWPPDRDAFADYWNVMVDKASIDEPVRAYLLSLLGLENVPRPLRFGARFNVWISTGFLPPKFRDQMGLRWTDGDEQRFTRLLRRIGAVQRRLPGPVRRFPFNWFLWDLRLRIRLNRRLV